MLNFKVVELESEIDIPKKSLQYDIDSFNKICKYKKKGISDIDPKFFLVLEMFFTKSRAIKGYNIWKISHLQGPTNRV